MASSTACLAVAREVKDMKIRKPTLPTGLMAGHPTPKVGALAGQTRSRRRVKSFGDGEFMSPYPDVTWAVIAGGQARRLSGVPKGLLRFEGRPVLERLLALSPLFAETLLVANRPEPYARFGLRTVADAVPDKGAPGGIHAALGAARTAWVLAVACDMPFVAPAAVHLLLEARAPGVDAVAFTVEGRVEPLLAVYRASLAKPWGELLARDNPSLRGLLAGCRARLLPEEALRAVDPQLRSRVSVNTPEDLARFGLTWPGPHGAGTR
jgi:molybdenum cofactor guanylyltransferase